jgi:malate synthase
MTERVQVGGLQVAKVLYDFVNNEAIPGTGVDAAAFWAGADSVIHDLAPKNRALLAKRDELQAKIDAWHQARAGQAHDAVAYKTFLQEIGYLFPEAEDFQATTENVDEEIARMAGPQLVVPIMNARFALNAANARWGSLYDALYGTDAISEEDGATKGPGYNEIRGSAAGLPGRSQRTDRRAAEEQRHPLRDPDRPGQPDRSDRRRRREGHPDGSGADHHHGLRRLHRRRRRRRQDHRLP